MEYQTAAQGTPNIGTPPRGSRENPEESNQTNPTAARKRNWQTAETVATADPTRDGAATEQPKEAEGKDLPTERQEEMRKSVILEN